MILVDTSVWVDHLRRRNGRLVKLLDEGRVAAHPFVVGELALGTLERPVEILGLLAELPQARMVRHEDVLHAVERHALVGAGIGWVDAHLIATALVDGLPLWTIDRALASVARRLRVSWPS